MNWIRSMISDTDGSVSSKRGVVLWIGIPIWTFLHWVVFVKAAGDNELKHTLVMYDFFIIVGGLGIILSEKFAPQKPADSPENKP